MLLRWIIVTAACLWSDAAKASFYDNPEQDPLQPEDTAEDLHNKWDFEVGEILGSLWHFYFHMQSFLITRSTIDGDSGLSLEYRPLLI